jgi:hypothetical protein
LKWYHNPLIAKLSSDIKMLLLFKFLNRRNVTNLFIPLRTMKLGNKQVSPYSGKI